MTLAALNLLAFAWHTVLELLEPPGRPRPKPSEPASSFTISCCPPTSSFPLVGPTAIHYDLHYPARTRKNPRQPLSDAPKS